MKCQECKTQKKAENCQVCYRNEKKQHRYTRKEAERAAELHKKAMQEQIAAHEATKQQNLELIGRIKKGLRDILENRKLFQTRNQLFNFLEDLEESTE